MRLAGKTILVTGAASGIGEATVNQCRREGATVIAADRVASGGIRPVDVSVESSVADLMAGAGPLDGLVHCAGIAVRKPVASQDAEGWDEVFRVNVRGTYLCCRYALPRMRPGASIVLMASVVGLTGVRNRAAYSSTKGAVIALTRNMAMDYAPRRIRVNCLCPGFTRTNLTRALLSDPEAEARLTSLHPLGRLGEPDDIAHAALFLLSEEASWITGQAIAVDGGFTAGHALDV